VISLFPDPYDPRVIADAARFCFELGADVVKTMYTGTAESFRQVAGGTPIPVGILGGRHTGSLRDCLIFAGFPLKR
jgi:DhnA family fructose-bisphosphate aldolase class Ia